MREKTNKTKQKQMNYDKNQKVSNDLRGNVQMGNPFTGATAGGLG